VNTKHLPSGYRRRAKRAARKLACTHPGDIARARRAMDARDRAIRGDHLLTARIAELGDIDPPAGYIYRACARARAEGIIP